MGGVRVRLDFPHLRNLTDQGNVSLNKAELIFNVVPDDTTIYPPPTRVLLVTKNEVGDDVFIDDFFEGTDFFGGQYDFNSNTIKFNIARHLDGIINEKLVDRGLFAIVSGSAVNANRLVFYAGNHPVDPISLRLTFTQL